MPQVQRIDPIVLPSEKESVAAYCRVSTDSADQLNSYHSQIAYYTKLINENPDWELYDIYADAGITGTSIDKRDEFKRMIVDCREGRIKRVLVKSVSRFARNTTELLETTRELKDLGVVVVFEEQGFDTSQVLGEMQLTMYAMAAQEESFSISNNMRWSYQKRMQNGLFMGTRAPFGYRLINGELEIELTEAKVVKEIFGLYLKGNGVHQIVNHLNCNNIPAHDGKGWRYSSVRYILSNERYIGNALLQKFYTVDPIKHNKVRNRNDAPQYYVEKTHSPIISEEEFELAKRLLKKNTISEVGHGHLFTHRISCPTCHKYFREIRSNGKSYWLCPNRVNGISECAPLRYFEDNLIIASLNFMANIVTFEGDQERIKEMLSAIQNDEYGLGSISFDKIIPMPPELDIECGRNKTDPQVIRNIQKYGAPDWYDWCREHWNTKWDAGGYEKGKDYSQCDKLAFWTAWQEPAPVIQKLSEMYPDIEFTHQWAEEHMVQDCGTAKYKAGVQTEYEQVEGYDEMMDFSVEVWYQFEHNGLPPEQEQTM